MDAAEDIAAQVFVDAFRHRDAYIPSYESARPWLFGIASNEIHRRTRDERRRLRAYARALVAQSDKPDQSLEAEQYSGLRPELARALADLDAGDRDVLLLSALADLSYEEIAVALGIPIGTVGSRMNRARRKIRQRLGAETEKNPSLRTPTLISKESAWTNAS
jgi:RNA polymerase sigma-70 factor (ECF subfamily)